MIAGRFAAMVGLRRLRDTGGAALVQHVSRIYALLGLATNNEDHRRVLAVVRYRNR
jgi:hypothetical protein